MKDYGIEVFMDTIPDEREHGIIPQFTWNISDLHDTENSYLKIHFSYFFTEGRHKVKYDLIVTNEFKNDFMETKEALFQWGEECVTIAFNNLNAFMKESSKVMLKDKEFKVPSTLEISEKMYQSIKFPPEHLSPYITKKNSF